MTTAQFNNDLRVSRYEYRRGGVQKFSHLFHDVAGGYTAYEAVVSRWGRLGISEQPGN